MNFRQLDLNLLRVLAAIHRTGSVTLAGKTLALSQPATSNALARLRDFFEDELFVRAPSGLKPTRLCEQLAPAVLAQLLALETLVTGHEEFDPASSTMTFRIGLSDDVEYSLLPTLLRALREEAPHIVIVVKQVNYWNVSELLVSGEITAGVCLTRDLPANAKRKLLRTMKPMVVRADDASQPITLDEYCSRPHVVVSHVANISSFADEWLDAVGRKRHAVLSVPQYSTLPALMAGTNLICNLPDQLAVAFANAGLLHAESLPFITPDLELSMVWLSMMDTDPAERWLRKRLEQFMSDARFAVEQA